MVRGLVHLAVSFIGAGKVLGRWVPVSRLGNIARANVQGALATFVTQDPLEAGLAGLLAEYPELEGPVAELLAADPGDDRMIARAKAALVDLGIGVAADALVGLVFLLRSRTARSIRWHCL